MFAIDAGCRVHDERLPRADSRNGLRRLSAFPEHHAVSPIQRRLVRLVHMEVDDLSEIRNWEWCSTDSQRAEYGDSISRLYRL